MVGDKEKDKVTCVPGKELTLGKVLQKVPDLSPIISLLMEGPDGGGSKSD